MSQINFYSWCKFLFITCAFVSCGIKYKIKDGKTAYDFKRYSQAIELFQTQLAAEQRKEGKAFLHYYLAQSYDKLNKYPEAIEHYGQAVQLGQGSEASLKKAYALKRSMQYKLAAAEFGSLENVPELRQEVSIQKGLCIKYYEEISRSSKNVIIERFLPTELGSNYLAVNYDDNFMVFTADGKEVENSEVYNWTGRRFSDIFIADKASGEISKFDNAINSNFNDGTPAFNKDNSLMVFTRCFDPAAGKDEYCKLMLSRRFNGLWGPPKLLEFTEENVNYAQPCFFEGDSILIFSAKPKGIDQFDLYYAEWDGTTFVEPFALPKAVNSPYNEHFPVKDGDTLYFSSDRTSGYGGLDIYKTFVNKEGDWATSRLLPYPYNTGGDDFGILIDRNSPKTSNVAEVGYISSSRGNNGLDNIYKYKILKENEDIPIPNVVIKKDTVPKPTEMADVEVYLALKILDASNRKPIPGAVITLEFSNKSLITGKSDRNGLLLIQIPSGLDIVAKASTVEYLKGSIAFDSKGLKVNPSTINKEILLSKIEVGKEIVLNDIYYDYDKWDLKPEAMPSLIYLTRLLDDNPSIKIELGSHTDCRGEKDYNEDLSKKRAQSVIDYLLNRGIQSTRLVAKGYGENVPAIDCVCASCTEEDHQLNRRTSFKIL
jgi:peptidoglycan-associated lipoprotein